MDYEEALNESAGAEGALSLLPLGVQEASIEGEGRQRADGPLAGGYRPDRVFLVDLTVCAEESTISSDAAVNVESNTPHPKNGGLQAYQRMLGARFFFGEGVAAKRGLENGG